MQLIGMLDSPYVRRVAITLYQLTLPFEHRPISVFRQFAEFQSINPVVKAPSLVCDDGEVLMDSTLIIDYLESIAPPGLSLMSSTLLERRRALQTIGLALAACEKTVQIVYERQLRPPEKQHEPWIERVSGQLHRAYATLEAHLGATLPANPLMQDTLTLGVAWAFTQMMLPDMLVPTAFPRLQALSAHLEQHPAFKAFPQN
jgi:glutathione S-transferase